MTFLRSEYEKDGLQNLYYWYGDWVPPAGYGMTDPHLTASFAFLKDTRHLAMVAQKLNLTAEAANYSALYTQAAAEFHHIWYKADIQGYADGSQAANTMALALPGVVPANLTKLVLQSLVQDLQSKGHFTTGVVSIAWLFPVLSQNGQHDLALRLIQNTSYPSYGYQFNNPYENATTVWETWDVPFRPDGPWMASRNRQTTETQMHTCTHRN